jgi:hypothetical protein
MQIILQSTPVCRYINSSDKPKGTLDLFNKTSLNQGVFSFYRGNNALSCKLTVQLAIRFRLLNEFKGRFESDSTAAFLTALVSTLVTYPLDVA